METSTLFLWLLSLPALGTLTVGVNDGTGALVEDALVIVHPVSSHASKQIAPGTGDLVLRFAAHTGKYSAEAPAGDSYDILISRAGFKPQCTRVYLPSQGKRAGFQATIEIENRSCFLDICDN